LWCEKCRRGQRYILGGHNFSVRDALTQAAQVAGVNLPHFEIPMSLVKGLVLLSEIFPSLPLPSNHLRALPFWQGYNSAKAQQELGLSVHPFSETVQDALKCFTDEEYLY
jgi:hypothetical protein